MKTKKDSKKDWRIQNQEKYLKGVTLQWKKWTPPKKTWDHDHCDFCWKTISDIKDKDIDNGDTLHWMTIIGFVKNVLRIFARCLNGK